MIAARAVLAPDEIEAARERVDALLDHRALERVVLVGEELRDTCTRADFSDPSAALNDSSSEIVDEELDEPARLRDRVLHGVDALLARELVGVVPLGIIATRADRPAARHGSLRGARGLAARGVAVEAEDDAARERLRSFACSSVNAVPSGATTFCMPRAWSETTSKFPSTRIAASSWRIA